MRAGNFFASHRYVIPLILVAVAVVLVILWPRLKPRVLNQWHKAKQGAAIFSDWGRYGRQVALPSGASYACRIAVNIVFMAAFRHPGHRVHCVPRRVLAHALRALRRNAGGGGSDPGARRRHATQLAASSSIAAFSVTQDAILTIWNVVLGLAVMLWAFGFDQMKQLLSKSERAQLEQPST
jgi:hypothetical protein